MTAQTVAIVTAGFPSELNLDALLPAGVQCRQTAGVRELSGSDAALSAVVLFADATSGVACPALHEFLLLRTSGAIPASLRSIPALIMSDYPTEDLLRLDPAFLPFASPGTTVLGPPFTRNRVEEALQRLRPAELETIVRYLDIDGQLAKLRARARHRVSNALGPQVLVASARAGGAISAERAQQVCERIARAGAPDPVATEYAELLSLARPRPSASAAKVRENALDVQKERLSVLLLDDDRTAGWPEALAGVLQLGESSVVCPQLPCRGFSRGAFHLDCWTGSELDALLTALCPEVDQGEYVRLAYDAVLLDLRLQNELPEMPTQELSGYKCLKRVLSVDPTVQAVLFTASKNALHVREMLDQEIAGYYPKEDVLPDPASANWGRLREALQKVIQNRYRRDAFWALCQAWSAAAAQEWHRRGREEETDKLFAYVDHLEALVFLRETALPEPLELRMRRHFIDSAHAVMDAVLHMRFPRTGGENTTGQRVGLLPRGSAAYQAARWLNEARNDMVHRRGRGLDRGGPHDHLAAISAACTVLSDGQERARLVFDRVPRQSWPAWVTGTV
jgi:hypothetical protein